MHTVTPHTQLIHPTEYVTKSN